MPISIVFIEIAIGVSPGVTAAKLTIAIVAARVAAKREEKMLVEKRIS